MKFLEFLKEATAKGKTADEKKAADEKKKEDVDEDRIYHGKSSFPKYVKHPFTLWSQVLKLIQRIIVKDCCRR